MHRPRSLVLALPFALTACAAPGAHESGAPVLVAHRGNSSAAPENTLAAVRSALALPAPPEAVEIDVHGTADGRLAVIHDATLDRTTDGAGEVAELEWAEIRRYSAGYAEEFGDAFADERVPSLEEVLEAVADHPARVMIEIKDHGLGAPVAGLLQRRGETRRHLVASFHPDVLVDAALADDAIELLHLTSDPTDEQVELARLIGADILGVTRSDLRPELVALAHAKGLKVWVWTVDDQERARELLAWGVDGIISNRPAEMRQLARLRR